MRLILLSSIFFLTAIHCRKSNTNPIDLLPPVTNTGVNSFGCLVNNNAMIPRDGLASIASPSGKKAVEFVSGTNEQWVELNVGDYREGKPVNNMLFHFQNLSQLKEGDYVWKQTTFEDAVTGFPPYYQNHTYCRAYNYARKLWVWYGSYESSGKTTITKYDSAKHIISGIFSGKLREKNGTEEINITNGRFDLGPDLYLTKFP